MVKCGGEADGECVRAIEDSGTAFTAAEASKRDPVSQCVFVDGKARRQLSCRVHFGSFC